MADYSALDRALVGDKCSVVHQRVLATLVHTDWLPLLSLCQPTSGPKMKIMLDGNMTMQGVSAIVKLIRALTATSL